MRILYLYAEVMGYTMATIKALVDAGAEVHVVYWDHKKITPYQISVHRNVYHYPRSQQTFETLTRLVTLIKPDITVISGWLDNLYLKIAFILRKQGGAVAIGFDEQWRGTLKQHIAKMLGKIGIFSSFFSHAWVAGPYQYEYAHRLGFHKKNIIFDLYSADLSLFRSVYQNDFAQKKVHYPHRFLYVGRFEPIKGLESLVAAWCALESDRRDWELHLVGNGSLKERLLGIPGTVVKDFMVPELLVQDVCSAGCFILPSIKEPWGVVVHEFASTGLPMILSDVVGSASLFLIPGYNGYSFKAGDADQLAKCMLNIIAMSTSQLFAMGVASHSLSQRITPLTSAENLLSISRS